MNYDFLLVERIDKYLLTTLKNKTIKYFHIKMRPNQNYKLQYLTTMLIYTVIYFTITVANKIYHFNKNVSASNSKLCTHHQDL